MYLKSGFVLLNVFICILCESGIDLMLPKGYTDENLKSIPCIRHFFYKYFNSGQSVIGSIIEVSINGENSIFQNELLNMLYNDQSYKWTIMIKDINEDSDAEYESAEKTKNYLMFIDNAEEVEDIVAQWQSLTTWNPLAPIFSVFTQEMESDDLDEATEEVISTLVKNSVLNLNVISQNVEENSIQITTLFPYENDNCAGSVNNTEIVDICEYNNTIDNDDNILITSGTVSKKKIPKNLHKCPINVAARLWEPFTSYDPEKGFDMGIDVMLIKTIGEYFNLSCKIMMHNKTIYYLYQDLMAKVIDLVIGGVDEDPDISELLSSSIAYYQDDLTWCVNKAGHLPQWMNIFSMFDSASFLSILGIIIISALFIFYFHKVGNDPMEFNMSVTLAFAISICQSVNLKPPTIGAYLFLTALIWFGYNITTVYQTYLISILTEPTLEVQIKTVQQIYENKMDVTGDGKVVRHFHQKSEQSQYFRSNLVVCVAGKDCLIGLSTNKYLAVAISREHAHHNPRILKDSIFCFPQTENIYSYPVSILTSKDYHLLETFNRIIRYITEAGFIEKWKKDFDNIITIKQAYHEKKYEEPNISITVEHLFGAFIIEAVCITLSSIVFIIELIIYRVNNGKKNKSNVFYDYTN